MMSVMMAAKIEDVDDNFDNYQKKHAKTYASEEEKSYRAQVFKENIQKIKQHNSNTNKTYTQGVNEFTDMTNEEFVNTKLMTGTDWMDEDLKAAAAAAQVVDAPV